MAKPSMEDSVKRIIEEMGLDPNEEGLKDTPSRVARYFMEFSNAHDYGKILGKKFSSQGHHNMVVQHNIPFRGMCEHHLAPMLGRAAIGYVPGDHVVGLSKLTRLVQAVGTERPSLQEYMCDKIADLLDEHIKPKGVAVVIHGTHGCMSVRGINTPEVITTSSTVKGVFRDVPHARAEFFDLIRNQK